MKLSEIKIPEPFKACQPNAYKLEACRRCFEQNHRLDRNIVVNRDGVLVDGYIGYLVLMENGVESADVVCASDDRQLGGSKTVYVFGTHWKGGEEYCWRVTSRTADVLNLAVGRRAIVKTQFGRRTILVSRVEQRTDCPVSTKVKRVYRCLPS